MCIKSKSLFITYQTSNNRKESSNHSPNYQLIKQQSEMIIHKSLNLSNIESIGLKVTNAKVKITHFQNFLGTQ